MNTQNQTCGTHTQHIGVTGFFSFLSNALAAWHQRRALQRLDEAALKDIGISQLEADLEANRPIWDVPAHWRH